MNKFYLLAILLYQFQIMKNQNMLDKHYYEYPDNDISSYKRFKSDNITNNLQTKTKVLQTKKQVAKKQRQKVRDNEQIKRIKQKQETQKRLRLQIQQKKRQLQLLDLKKQQAAEQQKRSYQLAIIKQEQSRMRMIEKQNKKRQNQKMAKERAQAAYKRLIFQKQQTEIKQRQANYRRQVIIQAQRQERQKAIKRKQILEARKQPQQEQKVNFDNFTKPSGRVAYNRNIDYTKTYMHNPIIIKNTQQIQQQQTAIQKARVVEQTFKQKRLQKQESLEKLKQKSLQRGKIALKKINDERLVQNLVKESEQKLRIYNLQKVELGKRDQLLGVKPGTLQQMEINKKIRNQTEFEEMFLKNKKLEWITDNVHNYEIQNHRKFLQKQKKQKSEQNLQYNSRLKSIEQSRIPNQSASKYSFQNDPYKITDEKSFQIQEIKSIVKSKKSQQDSLQQYNVKRIEQVYENLEKNQKNDKKPINNFIKQKGQHQNDKKIFSNQNLQTTNFIKVNKNRDILKQTQKIQYPYAKTQKQKLQNFIKENEQFLNNLEINRQKQRRVVYNKQQKEKLQSKFMNQFGNKTSNSIKKQNNKKLNNLCQNKQHSDLDYSQDSQIE